MLSDGVYALVDIAAKSSSEIETLKKNFYIRGRVLIEKIIIFSGNHDVPFSCF